MDPYRNRVGRLYRGDAEVGYVLVTVEPFSITTGGHLWWRRWGPTHDILWPWTVVDGRFSDSVLTHDATAEELSDYERGLYRYYGETLRVEWTGPAESAELQQSQFGR